MRLFNDVVFFLFAIGPVIVIVDLCIETLLSPAATEDVRKWAMSVLAAAAGGVIGYLVRR